MRSHIFEKAGLKSEVLFIFLLAFCNMIFFSKCTSLFSYHIQLVGFRVPTFFQGVKVQAIISYC